MPGIGRATATQPLLAERVHRARLRVRLLLRQWRQQVWILLAMLQLAQKLLRLGTREPRQVEITAACSKLSQQFGSELIIVFTDTPVIDKAPIHQLVLAQLHKR